MTSLRTISAVRPGSGYQLDVTWDNGTHSRVDMSGDIGAAGVFAPLADPAAFRSVRIGKRARTIEWGLKPGSDETLVDIDADALFAMSQPSTDQDDKMSAQG